MLAEKLDAIDEETRERSISDSDTSTTSKSSASNIITRLERLAVVCYSTAVLALNSYCQSEDVHKERMPHSIERTVFESNVHFAHQRDLFNPKYFSFIGRLIEISNANTADLVAFIPTAMRFFLNVFMHAAKVHRVNFLCSH